MSMSVCEAGRMGGLNVLRKYGRGHYADIGKAGQAAMRRKYPNHASKWGKLGGRPRKPNLYYMEGDKQ